MATGTANFCRGPVERLKNLIAASDTFQTLVGADNAADAEDYVYSPVAPIDSAGKDQRPFALIWHQPTQEIERDGSSVDISGRLGMTIAADIPADKQGNDPTSHAAAETWFQELVGNILQEMLDLTITPAAGTTVLSVTGLRMRSDFFRDDFSDQAVQGQFYEVTYDVMYSSVR